MEQHELTLSRIARRIRIKLNLSQADLAKELGISQASLSKLEAGKTNGDNVKLQLLELYFKLLKEGRL
jgi:transcriptional regulator with XRE-family HTH domain